eukprot:jgi/Chrzof1/13255/Cz07g26090.t1
MEGNQYDAGALQAVSQTIAIARLKTLGTGGGFAMFVVSDAQTTLAVRKLSKLVQPSSLVVLIGVHALGIDLAHTPRSSCVWTAVCVLHWSAGSASSSGSTTITTTTTTITITMCYFVHLITMSSLCTRQYNEFVGNVPHVSMCSRAGSWVDGLHSSSS